MRIQSCQLLLDRPALPLQPLELLLCATPVHSQLLVGQTNELSQTLLGQDVLPDSVHDKRFELPGIYRRGIASRPPLHQPAVAAVVQELARLAVGAHGGGAALRASGVERVTFEVAGLCPDVYDVVTRLGLRVAGTLLIVVTSPLDPGPLYPVALRRALLAKGGSRASRPRAEIDRSGTP